MVKLARRIYGATAFEVMDNIEEIFGLSNARDAMVMYSTELTPAFKLLGSQLNMVVSGEEMMLAVKNQPAVPFKNRCPYTAACNYTLISARTNNAGQLQRRMVVFPFHRHVTTPDYNLSDALDAEVHVLVPKIARAFRELVTRKRGDSIWNHMPARLKEESDRINRLSDWVESFFSSHASDFEFAPEYNMRGPVLMRMLQDYAKRCRDSGAMSDEILMRAFEKRHIHPALIHAETYYGLRQVDRMTSIQHIGPANMNAGLFM
jgi:hypothetical protein